VTTSILAILFRPAPLICPVTFGLQLNALPLKFDTLARDLLFKSPQLLAQALEPAIGTRGPLRAFSLYPNAPAPHGENSSNGTPAYTAPLLAAVINHILTFAPLAFTWPSVAK
jgi:hypothetical protein